MKIVYFTPFPIKATVRFIFYVLRKVHLIVSLTLPVIDSRQADSMDDGNLFIDFYIYSHLMAIRSLFCSKNPFYLMVDCHLCFDQIM